MKKNFLHYLLITVPLMFSGLTHARTVIAIDAGHGGKDRGATGQILQIKEKDVVLSIAKELKALLDKDPNFKAVMIRNGDNFISVPERTEIARKNKANYLVSIHADSIPHKPNLKGAVVWVLSNRRANDELGKWLEDHEKQSELLGGTGEVLSQANEQYLSQTVLDLQFSYAQRSGYELGKAVIKQLDKVAHIARNTPQHASFGVLRAPDIPSILIETGFISNAEEEKKLSSLKYRRQIARAIYNGLVAYNQTHPISNNKKTNTPKTKIKSTKENTTKSSSTKTAIENDDSLSRAPNTRAEVNKRKRVTKNSETEKTREMNYHIVEKDQTLYAIARMYNTTPEALAKLNNIKGNKITVGKKLKIK